MYRGNNEVRPSAPAYTVNILDKLIGEFLFSYTDGRLIKFAPKLYTFQLNATTIPATRKLRIYHVQ